jgi:hypothetical protein
MAHSTIVGGSTAKRVISCPGSVALVQKVPPAPSSSYADEGTLLHEVIAEIMQDGLEPKKFIGREYNGITLTEELYGAKLLPALLLFEELDPNGEMELMVETRVSFGQFIPDVFGSCDVLGRIGSRAFVVDWKFGDGVPVIAEENPQLLFYAAAARRTEEAKWIFKDVDSIECVIIQPTRGMSRWVTTLDRLDRFERDLKRAVKTAQMPDAPLAAGSHCRFCAAKPICPIKTGEADRAVVTTLQALDVDELGHYLNMAKRLEEWSADLHKLAQRMLEAGVPIPGWKLVPKRGIRQWVDEELAKVELFKHLKESDVVEHNLISPAKAEKLLKAQRVPLPNDLVVSVSSGSTLAPEDDPRPAVLNIGKQLVAALGKIGE